MIKSRLIGRIGGFGVSLLAATLAFLSWREAIRSRSEVEQMEKALHKVESSTERRMTRAERQVRLHRANSEREPDWYAERAVSELSPSEEVRTDQHSSEDEIEEEVERELTPEEQEYRNGVLGEAQIERLESAYGTESTDPEWSSDAEDALSRAYQTEAFNSLTVVPRCKKTLCRLEVTYDDTENTSQQLQLLAHRTPWQGQGFQKVDTKTQIATFYLAREGHELAQVDPEKIVY